MQKAWRVIVLLAIASFILWRPLLVSAKVLLLITQEFPQFPAKPLHALTPEPKKESVEFNQGEIIADVVVPQRGGPQPALIIATGVRAFEKDRPTLFGFMDTLARLGYVVVWPRTQALEDDIIKVEEPQTFVESFKYLKTRPEVNPERISFFGISAGSSLALIAAENPEIADEVHALLFFGGYYNVFSYLDAINTSEIEVDGKTVPWQPGPGLIERINDILGGEEASEEKLARFSPDKNLDNFKARIFILHDRSDNYVPWVESQKLKDALEGKVPVTYHLANLFQHVGPKQETNFGIISEFLGLYIFLYRVIAFL